MSFSLPAFITPFWVGGQDSVGVPALPTPSPIYAIVHRDYAVNSYENYKSWRCLRVVILFSFAFFLIFYLGNSLIRKREGQIRKAREVNPHLHYI